MPLFTAEIPETHQRINRPIIKQILDDIISRYKDIPFREFRFTGNSDQLLTPGSALGDANFNRELSSNYVDITVDDEPDEEYDRSYATASGMSHPIFRCTKTRLDLYPVYENRKLTINLKVVCGSRVLMNNLITRIKQGMYQSMTTFTHKISYNYDLPVAVYNLINTFYHYMERNYPYGIDFPTWWTECKHPNMDVAFTQDGGQATLIMREDGANVLSQLGDSSREPVKEKEKDDGVWSTEIDIEVRYQRPNVIRASYPPLVHNQLLPEAWFNDNRSHDYTNEQSTSTLANIAMEQFKWNMRYGLTGRGDTGVKLPYFDDWGKQITNKKMVKIFSSLVMLDEAALHSFFDMYKDIDTTEYFIPESFLKLMKCSPMNMRYEGQHFFHIKAYCWNNIIPPECINIDSNLNITIDHELNPRDYYHLVLCLNADPSTINLNVWQQAYCCVDGLIDYFGLFGDVYSDKLRQALDDMDYEEGMCLTAPLVNGVINDMIDAGLPIENGGSFNKDGNWRLSLDYLVDGRKM